ncbi:MAG: hypothetical protein ACR2QC_01900, partial [Gammaproteobacteria bacterium]
ADIVLAGAMLKWDEPAEGAQDVAEYWIYRSKLPIPDDIEQARREGQLIVLEARVDAAVRQCAVRMDDLLRTYCIDVAGEELPSYYRIVAVNYAGERSLPSGEVMLNPRWMKIPAGEPLNVRKEPILREVP